MLKKSLFCSALLLSLSGVAFAQATNNAPANSSNASTDDTAVAPWHVTDTSNSLYQAFADADALFVKRDQGDDQGLANTLAARDAYQKIIDGGAKGSDLVAAVDGLFRSLYYQGEVLTGKTTDADKKARKAIFDDCFKRVAEYLNPKAFGTATPEYYYFRASCMAHSGEVANVLEQLAVLPSLLQTFTDGEKVDGTAVFEGGGLARVKAAVKGNSAAKGLPGGLYDPQAALALINQSLAVQNGDKGGDVYCENYYRKAITLSLIDGSKADAKALALQAASDFQDYLDLGGVVPEDVRAETVHCISETKAFADTL